MNIDPITLTVVWDRMIGICNQQVAALQQTSFSPVVREAGDLAAALFDPDGRMLCQPITGTPGHINPLSAGVKNMLVEIPNHKLKPGDVLITNDPWLTTGQLLDVTVLVPIFRQYSLVAFFACTCHMVDIGGYGPGVGASDCYEEGLCLPVLYLRREGVSNDTLVRLLRANNRNPENFMGDLNAMVSSCYVGGSKLIDLLDEYGLQSLAGIGEAILSRSREAQEKAIRQLPDGTYYGETSIDGFDERITLRCTVTIQDGTVDIDYAGTSAESSQGINVVLNYTAGYATFAVRSVTAPDVPNNDGSMSPIRVRAPKGCILNAQRPAPTTGRHLVGQFVAEPVLQALRPLVGQRGLAEGAGAVWTVEVRVRQEGRARPLFLTVSGGMGARACKDGLNTVSFPASIAGVPVEIWEATIPVLILRRELRVDSGGPGRYRGGLGQAIEFTVPGGDRWLANLMTERVAFGARGAAGGRSGAVGRVCTGDGRPLPVKGRVTMEPGCVIRLETPGGGGWGPAYERDVEAVWEDFVEGYVSRHQAEEVYGVILDAEDRIDWEATRRRRVELRAQHGATVGQTESVNL